MGKLYGMIFVGLFVLWSILLAVLKGLTPIDGEVHLIVALVLFAFVSIGVIVFWCAFLFIDDI